MLFLIDKKAGLRTSFSLCSINYRYIHQNLGAILFCCINNVYEDSIFRSKINNLSYFKICTQF